jgi:hypothetical protein
MSRSRRTDPYPIRAARRARARADIWVRRARPGFLHPAGVADIAQLLEFFGPSATYGLRGVELRHAVGLHRPGPILATLRVPGVVVLYEQPPPPWTIPGPLTGCSVERLRRAGARVSVSLRVTGVATRVDWPADTLRDFMLFDGLMHEIGHHIVQYGAGNRTDPVMRAADHERRADAFAAVCRAAWTAGAAPG